MPVIACMLSGLAVACSSAIAPTPFPTAPPRSTSVSVSVSQTPNRAATVDPTIPPTEDPYRGLTIEDLRSRAYGGGSIAFGDEQRVSSSFSRYLFDYPSDGLTIHGFANIPAGEGPFAVVFVLHGYIDPVDYETLAYTTRYADALASRGFLVLHPNYRNYPPSDEGPNAFRVGYAVDVRNLIELVQEQAGQPGPLEDAMSDAIGLFGHSMGGGISLRLLASQAPVRAAVLYGSMNADEALNFEKIYEWSEGERGLIELNTLPSDMARISSLNYLGDIEAAVSIHHGEQDELVPPEWSDELCSRLAALGKIVECFTYPNEPHTFIGFGGIQLIDRAVSFYSQHLGVP